MEQESSMHWASDFSVRSCSSKYFADRFNLENKTWLNLVFTGTIMLFDFSCRFWENKCYKIQNVCIFLKIPFVFHRICKHSPYRICSVICSTTRCRMEATSSKAFLSLSSSMCTLSCSLSQGGRFILHTTEQKEQYYCRILQSVSQFCHLLVKFIAREMVSKV